MMRRFILLLAVIAMPVLAAEIKEDPLERAMLSIARDLRCTVCQNQPISESEADLARDMRDIIREQLVAGKSRQEIIDYFVARYGDYVLMKPPYQGPGVLVWVGPLVLIASLATGAFVYLRRRLHVPLPPPPKLSAEDAARVRDAKRQLLE
jgi:cytochrome c-type biogenesis protein CcmH